MGYSQAYMSVCLSVRLYVSLYEHLCCFLTIIRGANNCANRMRTQATGSNPLSGSIICPSVRMSIHISVCVSFHPRAFCDLVICVNPQSRFQSTPVGSSWTYMSVCLSVSLYLCPFVRIAFWWSFAWPVITCSAYSHRPWFQISWVVV